MIGIIDEIQMPMIGIPWQPMLVDTKTRSTPTVPSEAQKRNGRFAPYIFRGLQVKFCLTVIRW
jgi:exonuclease V